MINKFEAVPTALFLVINFNTIDFQSHLPFELLTVISESTCFCLIVRMNSVLCDYREGRGNTAEGTHLEANSLLK
jgi:hypothetical protein